MARLGLVATLLSLIIFPTPPLFSQDDQERPKVGLVLSGGGARGGAHVGVLKALEELGVKIDYIAGTSMGAIVGGFYATGYSAAQIEHIMLEMNWEAAFSDQPQRQDQSMRKKELENDFLIPFRLGFNKGSLQLPLGLVEGQHLDQIFQRILLPAEGITDFDRLHIPFRAVATDLVTGKAVVMSRGSLSGALRASMSVPGVFAPVRMNDRLLVDGGMANNLPVNVAREMGADIIIAVDISSPLLDEKQLKSVLNVTEQLTNFLTRNNTDVQIASLAQGDILLVPELEGFSSANFEAASKLVDIGYQAVMIHEQQLAMLSSSLTQPESLSAEDASADRFIVNFIELNNRSVLADEIIQSRIKVPLGQPLDIDGLDRMMDQVYSLDVFQSVTYSLVQNDDGETGLIINAIPRAWGPNYLQFGLEFSDDFSGSSEFKLGTAYTRNALNKLGGELRISATIGREDELKVDFYQPIDKQARWYLQPEVFLRRQQFNVWEGETRLAILDIAGEGARFGIGRNFNTSNLVRLTYEFVNGKADYIVGELPGELDDNVDIGQLQLEYLHDSLDSLWFPSEGMFHSLAFVYADTALGADSDYEQIGARGSFTFSPTARDSLLVNYELGYSIDDKAPLVSWFRLGGFGRLSGLIPDQLSGRQLGLLSLAYHRRLNDVSFLPVYAGMTLEAGNVWNYVDDVRLSDLRYSGSIFVGARTPIGPVYLAWGHSDNGDGTLYFYLGNPFSRNRF